MATSPPSNNDLASTLAFSSVTSDFFVSFAHLEELRNAVNAVRGAWGDPQLSWTDILNPSVNSCAYGTTSATPIAGQIVYAAHVMRLRCAMDNALIRGAVATSSYTDPDVTNLFVRAGHVTELQQRTQ